MLIKQALFLGTLKPGQEAKMRTYVEQVLAPLWQKFTGAARVEVLFSQTLDSKGPEIPLILSIAYENQAKLEEAMASPARHESRALLPAFYKTYWAKVDLAHITFEVLDPGGGHK